MDHYDLSRAGAGLPPVDWSPVTPADEPFGNPPRFPPEQVQARIGRSRLRWDMQHGVWGHLLGITERELTVKVNHFRTIGDRLGQFLTSSELLTGDPARDYEYGMLVSDAAMAILRDATPIFWVEPEADMPQLLDARFFWFTTEGWVYAVPQPALYGSDATLAVTMQRGETLITGTMSYESLVDNFAVGANPRDANPGTLLIDSEQPWPNTLSIPGRFGQSMFDVAAPMILEISRRHSANSYALNRLADPSHAVLAREDDLERIEHEGGENEDITSDDAVVRSAGMSSYLDTVVGANRFVSFDQGVQGLQAIEFDGKVTESGDTIDLMRTEIETAVHMPDLFNGFVSLASAPSGVALKRLNQPLYATVRSAQSMIRRGIEESLSEAGVDASFEWIDVFDALEGDRSSSMEVSDDDDS